MKKQTFSLNQVVFKFYIRTISKIRPTATNKSIYLYLLAFFNRLHSIWSYFDLGSIRVQTASNSPPRPPILRLSQTRSRGPDGGARAPEAAAADASCFQACGLKHTHTPSHTHIQEITRRCGRQKVLLPSWELKVKIHWTDRLRPPVNICCVWCNPERRGTLWNLTCGAGWGGAADTSDRGLFQLTDRHVAHLDKYQGLWCWGCSF